jgi:acyl-CoA synthetase (AMP-forming)/AMP-acid ligase II/thioesterase domain-containing protein/acyl carrier protein
MKKLAITTGEPFSRKNFAFCQNIPSYLKQAVSSLGDAQLFDISTDGDSPGGQTYTELWHRATCTLGGLRQKGVLPPQPVIVILDRSQDFSSVLWGCWMGGFAPIPLQFSSNPSQPERDRLKVTTALKALAQPVIITTSELAIALGRYQLLGSDLTIIELENLEAAPADEDFHLSTPDNLGGLFLSSGTTGKPKLVSFTCEAILNRLIENQPEQPEDIHSLYWLPLDHASTSLRVVNPDAQTKIFLATEAFLRNPCHWLDALEQYKVSKTSMTNFGMALVTQSVKSSPECHWDLRSLKNIGIGAEAITPKTYQAFLESLMPFGLDSEAIFTGYGLTECGTVVGGRAKVVTMGDTDSQYIQLGEPCPGYAVRIVDGQNATLNEGEIGQVQVKGPSTIHKYHNKEEETKILFSDDGWLNTGDLGLIQEGSLTITGRAKDIIIINAKNYSCQEIELVVEEVQGVESSYTVACPLRQQNSETDDLAILFHTLVTAEGQLVKLIQQIRRKVSQTLGINPTYIIPVDKTAIPRTSNGKIQRLQVKESLESGEFEAIIQPIEQIIKQDSERTLVASRNELEKELTKIWEKVLGIQPIGIHNNFFDLGGHSLLAGRLLTEVEKVFQKNLPLAALFQTPTIAELTKILSQEKWSSSWYSLVPIQPIGDRIPLFAIHILGEGFNFYRPLASYLGQRQPIYGLSYGLAARKGNEKAPPLPPTKLLAAHYIQEMQAFQPQGPYVLLGVSNGGNVAFEMAQQLQAQGQAVGKLILFDTVHPNVKLPPKWDDISGFQKLIGDLIRQIDIHWGNLLLFEPKERLSYLSDKVKAVSTKWFPQLPGALSRAFRSFVFKAKREPKEVNPLSVTPKRYIPQAYPGQITLFKAKHTAIASSDPTNGWEGLAGGGLEVYLIHGAHSKILSEPSVRVLAEQLKTCLEGLKQT